LTTIGSKGPKGEKEKGLSIFDEGLYQNITVTEKSVATGGTAKEFITPEDKQCSVKNGQSY